MAVLVSCLPLRYLWDQMQTFLAFAKGVVHAETCQCAKLLWHNCRCNTKVFPRQSRALLETMHACHFSAAWVYHQPTIGYDKYTRLQPDIAKHMSRPSWCFSHVLPVVKLILANVSISTASARCKCAEWCALSGQNRPRSTACRLLNQTVQVPPAPEQGSNRLQSSVFVFVFNGASSLAEPFHQATPLGSSCKFDQLSCLSVYGLDVLGG